MIEPRPAATVAVTRDTDAGLEVLLLQRTHSAQFMPGVFVFPGGAVDAADREPLPLSRTGGVDDRQASRMIGMPQGGLAFLLAAIRECFEEAGLLLADTAGSGMGAELAAWRRRLDQGELTLARLCEHLDLRLHVDRMAYLSHWVTPPGPPRRYDTRFFVAPAPSGQAVSHDGNELIDHLWVAPWEALARNQRGELPLGSATIRTLRILAEFDGTEQLISHARQRAGPAPSGPVRATGRDGPRLVQPGEPAYQELAKLHAEGLAMGSYEIIPGVMRTLSRRVKRLTAPNPGMMTGPGTNTYLLDTGDGLAVIDPGPESSGHLDALIGAADGPIGWILATHTHPDHSPAARQLKSRTGARVIGLPPPAGEIQDHSFVPDQVPVHGDRLRLGELVLRVIHTPGHASNHLCYLLEDEQLLFSGDHIMQGSTVVIGPPDGNMRQYLEALDALYMEDIAYIAPGHGFLMGDPYQVIDRISCHRMARENKVLRRLGALGEASEDTLLGAVYDDVPAALHGVAGRSLLAHLIKLRDDGVVSQAGPAWRLVYWPVAVPRGTSQ